MSDYSTPAVTDERTIKLAEAINEFADDVRGRMINVQTMIQETLDKQYKVNHEPQIELPFEKEYEYIKEKVNKSLASSYKNLDDFAHIFISGYLPNGKTIHPNSIEQDENGLTLSKYSQLYINGVPYNSDYTCRAEEGGWEKLNVLIIGAPKMSSYAARLDVDYADIPLKNFKMVVFDDLEETVNPDINSFLAEDIDTLKYIGNLNWTYTGLCTIRRLEVTKDIITTGTMNCHCITELIIPNVINVPNTSPSSKENIVLCDISNVKGVINNLVSANIGDLKLKGSSIEKGAFTKARLGEVNIGNNCQTIGNFAFGGSSIKRFIGGLFLTRIYASAFEGCSSLTDVVFNNSSPLDLNSNAIFVKCSNLKNIHFSYISKIGGIFGDCTSLTNLTFIDKSISCNLFFNASPVITEESCLNIINAIADNEKITVSLHSVVKNHMANDWYCKKENGKYVSCSAEDEGAIKQTEALIARGGTLA